MDHHVPALTYLRAEYLVNPLGLQTATPRLSWEIAAPPELRGLRQSAWQVTAATSPDILDPAQADLWDSGKVASPVSATVVYGGRLPASSQRVWWSARIWDGWDQPSPFSPAAFFETGLLEQSLWKAQWITADQTVFNNVPIPNAHLRREFLLPSRPTWARLYVTALGVYEPFVNGTRVGNDHLRPGWTDYAVRIQYQTYDVTALLREGANALGIILGDGWYCGELGWYDLTKKNRNHYGREPRALVQLVVRCGDGSAFTITSDEAWKGREGPILDSDFLMGETYDARREMPGWCEPGCDERDWRPVWVRPLCNTARAAGGVASTPLLKEVDGVPARADDSRDTHVVPLEGRRAPRSRSSRRSRQSR